MAKEIVYKIKIVDESGNVVEKAVDNIKELDESVSGLQKKLNETPLGSKEFTQLQKDLKNSKGALDEAKSSTMSLGEKFAAIPGPIGQAAQGIQGLGTAFKALIMNPVGLVIAAIALAMSALYKALTSTEKGTMALNKVMAALSGLIDPIIKLAQELALILVDGVLKAIEGVQAALSFLGFDSFAQASKDAENLAQSVNEVEEAEGDLNVERAKQNKQLAETREILADTNKSLAERKKALQEVQKSEEALAAKEVQLAEKRLANIREEIRLKGASKELNDAEEQALITLSDKQTSQAATRRKNIKAEQALEREAEAERKANADAATKRAEEAKKAAEDRLNFLKNINNQIIEDDRARELDKARLDDEARQKEINNLKFTGEQRTKALAASDELYRQTKADINKKFDDAEEKKREDDQKKIDDDNKLKIQKEITRIDALIQLESMKQQMDLEQLENYLNQKMELELANLELSEEEKNLIRARYAEQLVNIKKSEADKLKDIEKQKMDAEQASLDLSISAFDTLSQLAGENTELAKAMALISTSISTYDAAQKAYASQLLILTPDAPIRAGVAAAIAVAQGLIRLNKIASTPTTLPSSSVKAAQGGMIYGQGGSTSDNIPAMLSPGESVMNARSTAMFRPLLSSLNQMGGGASFTGGIVSNGVDKGQMALINSIRGTNEKPVQAYVVGSQMTNQAMLDRQIKTRSLI